MPIDNLPPLREVINAYGLQANKSLGQNFLFDLNLTSKIARQAGNIEGKPVIEIGPGPGGLTRALLAKGAIVTVIERDKRCLPALLDIEKHYPKKLNLIFDDALKQDLSKLYETYPEKPRIIANLPYNIGTQLLLNWLLTTSWPPFYESMTLMFQREVAERITATPQSPHYSRLSVLVGWRTIAKIAFDVPPQAFIPAPKVTSSVIHIIPRPQPLACSVKKLSLVTKAAFGEKRKMLRQSLKTIGGRELLEKAGIDETRRAETLLIHEFVTLANLMT
ncbi:ribosomal RNA small subunit methyltransferase A [Bartonella bacilliformis str. Heidi Mejia]|uniref:16S rRNA (adenine(1518)-N(6)/adenine(1519)-N(6))- dimethyltransferase RsmA n=1 Tax=Bartonella bacilliformis TaxID=774 RepID=UPI000451BE60|nr:16S rRNA (adenine(1518)-N(6)/adenine(1519)-N(6))-dimethyltransferase RsmA [Bartonella bacilliformis]EYS92216.1 ribosomal RNA small subunit methyltransferase A [Bartonella bacilliformis str. Heidi Mejia]KEG18713.1 ribosomal RNA small subunit methyltransferase A [Bartonella bacilliformis Hosp800-02]KEG23821.1 ribosomal RNA small subunit methyltransferase A [Bartonella bacilliformis VAB9028]KEG24170.1 ribosomal RNA small subunit methyltransferase A [Bartonella bacilliformis CAR600-02]